MLSRVHRFYKRFISPLFGNACRFEPSCSTYALNAIQIRGIFMGSWLAFRRILRCNPWNRGGPDPVPPRPVTSRSCRHMNDKKI